MIDHIHALPEGYRLQEYTITGVLGYGGFGITYSAHDTNLEKTVAIKEYLPSDLAARVSDNTISAKSEKDRESYAWGLARFLDEARTVARFDHPNIVRIHRFFRANQTGYIVMEFIDGQTLSSVCRDNTTLSEDEIRRWLWPVMEGLKVVHGQGFLHRDIKPQNIMMRNDGRPCLLDFGSARQAMGGRTRSLTSVMTPGYAPLEQYSTRGRHGPWTDIFALGAVIYLCMHGRKPPDVLDRLSEDRLSARNTDGEHDYSESFVSGCHWALKIKETDRPESIAAWVRHLDGENREVTRVMTPEAIKSREPARTQPIIRSSATTQLVSGRSERERIRKKETTETHLRREPEANPAFAPHEGVIADSMGVLKSLIGAAVATTKALISRLVPPLRNNMAKLIVVLLLIVAGVAAIQLSKPIMSSKGSEEHTLVADTQNRDPKQLFNMAQMYEFGGGRQKNLSEAARYYLAAANQNYTEAQFRIGQMYFDGEGVPQDYAESLNWFQLAADSGHAAAQYNLGMLYLYGRGTESDSSQARHWLEKASLQGNQDATLQLKRLEDS